MKLFLIHLIVFVLLFTNGFAENRVADSLIQKTCKRYSKFPFITLDYNLCVASLKDNPESQRVRNLDELTMVGANNAMSNLTNVKRIVEKIVKERRYKTRLSKKLLEDCLRFYSESYRSVASALNYIKSRNFKEACWSFRDAKGAPMLCELEFNGDNNQTSPVRKENDVLFDMINIAYQICSFPRKA